MHCSILNISVSSSTLLRCWPLLQFVPALYNKMSDLSASDVSRVLAAYSAACVYNEDLYTALGDFVWQKLSEMHPSALSSVAWAYASACHYNDDEDLFEGIARAAMDSIKVCHHCCLECEIRTTVWIVQVRLDRVYSHDCRTVTAASSQITIIVVCWPAALA